MSEFIILFSIFLPPELCDFALARTDFCLVLLHAPILDEK